MIADFEIPIRYIRKYISNYTTDKTIRDFVKGMVEDWLDEDDDVYEHYSELESIRTQS